MSQVRVLLLKCFKLRGLGPDKEAIRVLCEYLETSADASTEIPRIVEHIRSNPGLVKTRVTAELAEDAIGAVGGNGDSAAQDFVMILDHKAVPISVYDPVRKVFDRKPGDTRALVGGTPFSRIQAFRERYDIIEQRVRRNRHFSKTAFGHSAMIELTRISEVRSSKGRVFVLGMLIQPLEGKFYLEDMTHSMPIDMSQATSKFGLFTENSVVVTAGEYDRDIFRVHTLALPPVESRRETCDQYPPLAVPTFRKPYSTEEKRTLEQEELKEDTAQIVVLSDVWLDRPKVINGLRMMFFRYDALCKDGIENGVDYRFMFVLMGNFSSQPYSRGVAKHRALFDQLGDLIATFSSLAQCSTWIFVPGPNDVLGGNSLMLPRNRLPDAVSAGFLEKVPAASFCSDPCRIKFYTQELVFHRDDVCAKLGKHSRRPGKDDVPLWDHAARTLLAQAHLVPLPLACAPVDWAYDHALRLYPAPDLLVLGDRVERFDSQVADTFVANPGNFAADFTFYTYSPAADPQGRLEACALDFAEVPSQLEPERSERDMLKAARKMARRKAKREQRRAERRALEDGGEAAVDGKTPKTMKKRKLSKGGIAPAGQNSIGQFFAPKVRGEHEDEGDEEERGMSRRRVLQRGSDSEDSDSDSSSDESDEEAVADTDAPRAPVEAGPSQESEDAGVEGEEADMEDGALAAKHAAARRGAGSARERRRAMVDSDEDE